MDVPSDLSFPDHFVPSDENALVLVIAAVHLT